MTDRLPTRRGVATLLVASLATMTAACSRPDVDVLRPVGPTTSAPTRPAETVPPRSPLPAPALEVGPGRRFARTEAAACSAALARPGAVLVIGDSITARGAADLNEHLARAGVPACIDALARRATPAGIVTLRGFLARNALREDATVVMALGANDAARGGTWGTCQATTTLAAAGPRRAVLWVNAFHEASTLTKRNSETFNEEIAALAARTPRLTVADWNAHVHASPTLLTKDRVHPTPAGQRDWAEFVHDAIVRNIHS